MLSISELTAMPKAQRISCLGKGVERVPLWVKLGRKLDVRAESAFPTITDTTVATSGVYEFKP